MIARAGWETGRAAGRHTTKLGNSCDVLVFTTDEFNRAEDEPGIAEILRDGVALAGRVPTSRLM